MRVSHFVAAGMVAILIMLGGNLLLAPYGSDGYEELVAHKLRLEQNLEDLQRRQAELRGSIELLTRSTDEVELRARALGYYEEETTVVRLEGIGPVQQSQSPGVMILGMPAHTDRRGAVRIAAVGLALVVLTVSLISSGRRVDHSTMSRASR
jgi:cell division protein FtsB